LTLAISLSAVLPPVDSIAEERGFFVTKKGKLTKSVVMTGIGTGIGPLIGGLEGALVARQLERLLRLEPIGHSMSLTSS